MAITKQIKRLDKSNVDLTLTVPKDEVNTIYRDMLKDYSKNMQLPGFRKGHVPQDVLERKYGDALKQDALGRVLEAALHEVFEDKDLPRTEKPLPYTSPELQGEPVLDLDKDFQFSVVYDVLPEVKIGSWKGLKAEYAYAEVKKEDIDKELEGIRDRNAIVMDKDDNAKAAKGDVVTIDYQVFEEDGSPSETLQRKDFVFTLGSNTNPYQFDDDIAGMKKGETKEFDKKFDDNYFEASLAGKKRKVVITLTSLKEKKLPDLDDDLAQDVDEKFKTLEDLKINIKERLEKALEVRIRDTKTSALLAKIMENTPIILPESMIQAEVEGRWRRMARYYNMDPETMVQIMKNSEGDDRQKEWRDISIKALHSRLIIETLIEEQKIDVSDDDVEKEFEKIAAENNSTAEEIKKHYDEQGILYLKEEIKERQLIDLMFKENTLKQGKKENFLDFMNQNS
ncbi:MAG: trigger factor [Treponema sp.]|nr:trigger factor [Treponema sp.]